MVELRLEKTLCLPYTRVTIINQFHFTQRSVMIHIIIWLFIWVGRLVLTSIPNRSRSFILDAISPLIAASYLGACRQACISSKNSLLSLISSTICIQKFGTQSFNNIHSRCKQSGDNHLIDQSLFGIHRVALRITSQSQLLPLRLLTLQLLHSLGSNLH